MYRKEAGKIHALMKNFLDKGKQGLADKEKWTYLLDLWFSEGDFVLKYSFSPEIDTKKCARGHSIRTRLSIDRAILEHMTQMLDKLVELNDSHQEIKVTPEQNLFTRFLNNGHWLTQS